MRYIQILGRRSTVPRLYIFAIEIESPIFFLSLITLSLHVGSITLVR
jgi:hypothetical protein